MSDNNSKLRLRHVMGMGWYVDSQNESTGCWVQRSMVFGTIDEAIVHASHITGKTFFLQLLSEEDCDVVRKTESAK